MIQAALRMQVVGMTFPHALAITRLAGALAHVHHRLPTHAQSASSWTLSPSSMAQLVGAMNAQPNTATTIATRAIKTVMIIAASFGFSARGCWMTSARLGRRRYVTRSDWQTRRSAGVNQFTTRYGFFLRCGTWLM